MKDSRETTRIMADILMITSTALAEMAERLRADGTGTQSEPPEAPDADMPAPGSGESMRMVLLAFSDTTPETGLSQREASEVARAAGMNPRGLAGYFKAGLLKSDRPSDRRWITDLGRERLRRLEEGSS
jgi:hypothetical protein